MLAALGAILGELQTPPPAPKKSRKPARPTPAPARAHHRPRNAG
jgi:hypothetical protein